MVTFALTPEQERDVLGFDPWGERDATYRVLRSGFGVCRKPHECAICFGPINAGDRVWARSEVDDGKAATFRFCAECCWCIARRYDDVGDDPNGGFDRMYERWEIGRRRAEEARLPAAREAQASPSVSGSNDGESLTTSQSHSTGTGWQEKPEKTEP